MLYDGERGAGAYATEGVLKKRLQLLVDLFVCGIALTNQNFRFTVQAVLAVDLVEHGCQVVAS